MKPLGWGLDEDEFLKQLPYCTPQNINEEWKRCVSITQKDNFFWEQKLYLYNFKGDCGTLTLNGANTATALGLVRVKEVASKNGFDTVLATIVTSKKEKQKQIFLDAGWKVVVEGVSNRKENKYSKIVFALYIDNCEYKGYYG